MKSRTIIAAALAATFLLAGCAKKQEAPKEEPKAAAPVVDLAAEEQAIRNRSGEWMNYANSKDAASIAGISRPTES
jgi:outer membrane murein-binding lipoprotein Lpp